jgi:hypothetical protein
MRDVRHEGARVASLGVESVLSTIDRILKRSSQA